MFKFTFDYSTGSEVKEIASEWLDVSFDKFLELYNLPTDSDIFDRVSILTGITADNLKRSNAGSMTVLVDQLLFAMDFTPVIESVENGGLESWIKVLTDRRNAEKEINKAAIAKTLKDKGPKTKDVLPIQQLEAEQQKKFESDVAKWKKWKPGEDEWGKLEAAKGELRKCDKQVFERMGVDSKEVNWEEPPQELVDALRINRLNAAPVTLKEYAGIDTSKESVLNCYGLATFFLTRFEHSMNGSQTLVIEV